MRNGVKALLVLAVCSSGCFKKNQNASQDLKGADGKPLKVISIARPDDPKTLDPQAQLDSASTTFISSVYDTLIEYHYLKRPYSLEPLLLEKLPELSPDGLEYTFTLRKGVKFIDDPCFQGGKGRELVTDDVLYTLKRFADVNIDTQSWFFLDGAIEGLNDFRQLTQKNGADKTDYNKETVKGLHKIDDHSFSIHLTQKNPLILYAFAVSSLSIVPHEAVEMYKQEFAHHPVGTGPFYLKHYEKKQTMVLAKNPNYHMFYPTSGDPDDVKDGFLKDAGKQLPLVDEVHIDYIPESQPEVLKFKKGGLSWVALDRDNFAQMAVRDAKGEYHLKPELDKKFDLYSEPGLDMRALTFNLKDPLLGTNKNLRLALAHAVDVNKMVELLANGRGVKLNTPVPESIAGSEHDIGNHGIPYDLEKAKDYLAKAGFPAGVGLAPLTLMLPGTTTIDTNFFEFFRDSFAQLHVELKPDYKTWSTYLKDTEKGEFQISLFAWTADYPDAEDFFQLFYGPNHPPGQNSSSFDNIEFNHLYEESRLMVNSPERFAKFKRMAEIMREEVPAILLHTSVLTGLTQKWMRNFKRNMLEDRPFKFLNVDNDIQSKIVL